MTPSHSTEHTRVIDAPPRAVYGLVADVHRWPAIFGSCVHARTTGAAGRGEHVEMWTGSSTAVDFWSSHRTLDPYRLHIGFTHDHSPLPVTSLRGAWHFRALRDGRTEAVLRHRFRARDRDSDAAERLRRVLDADCRARLAELARLAEIRHPVDEVVFSFKESFEWDGGAGAAYDFMHRADLWEQRLPHTSRSTVTEIAPDAQLLELRIVAPDGVTHRSGSVRVCRAPEWIAYKQLSPHALLIGHSGVWTFEDGPAGPVVTSRHTLSLDPAAAAEAFGDGVTLAGIRADLQQSLGRSNAATMTHAAIYSARPEAGAR